MGVEKDKQRDKMRKKVREGKKLFRVTTRMH